MAIARPAGLFSSAPTVGRRPAPPTTAFAAGTAVVGVVPLEDSGLTTSAGATAEPPFLAVAALLEGAELTEAFLAAAALLEGAELPEAFAFAAAARDAGGATIVGTLLFFCSGGASLIGRETAGSAASGALQTSGPSAPPDAGTSAAAAPAPAPRVACCVREDDLLWAGILRLPPPPSLVCSSSSDASSSTSSPSALNCCTNSWGSH